MSRSKTLDRVADLFAHREEPPSRNAAYEAYRNPSFMESIRLHRHLRALADSLVTLSDHDDDDDSAKVVVTKDALGRWEFSYTIDQTKRRTFVRDDELEVLFVDPDVAAALHQLGLKPPRRRDDDEATRPPK